ncbi:MAG: alpha-ribazole phosphatase [Pseudomonadota bacterium]
MIYLMRHGEIQKRGQQDLVGQIDLPLSDAGLRQAHAWSVALQSTQFERICCSDLQRTRRMAEIVAGNRNQAIDKVPQLREINLGAWDGISLHDLHARFPGEWDKRGADVAGYRPPGGESFADLQARVVPVFLEIAGQAHSDVLIVAHAGVIRVIICHILDVPLSNLFRIGQDYAGLNMIKPQGDSFLLVAMNLPVPANGMP